MTNTDRPTKRRAGRWIAVLTAIAVGLTAFVIYLISTTGRITQQRDDARVRAAAAVTKQSTLTKRLARLTKRLTTLEHDNTQLRQQLEAAPKTSGTATDPSSDVIVRTLSMPLPDQGAMGLFLDEGKVSSECCGAEFNYERQGSTGRPQLVSNNNAAYSTAVESPTISREACSQAVATSPTITPIRPLHTGLLICVNTDTGTSLLQIMAAPRKAGRLKISQKLWPNP